MGRKEMSARAVNGSEQLSYWCLGIIFYITYCYWMQFCVKPATNTFLCCSLLTVCFFRWWFRKTCRPFFYNFWHSSFRLSCIFTLYYMSIYFRQLSVLRFLSRSHRKVGKEGSYVATAEFGSSYWKIFLRTSVPKK